MQNKNPDSVSGYLVKETLYYDYKHPQLRLLKKIIENLYNENFKTTSPVKILDIGSSTGMLGRMLGKGKFQYQGLDFAVELPDIITYDINQSPLPFENNSYDIVVAGGSLEYAVDRTRLFEDIDRIIKPGGYFMARYINRESFLQSFLTIVWPAKKGNPYMIPWVPPQEFEKELQRYFNVINVFGIPFPTPLWQPSLISEMQSIPLLSAWLAQKAPNTCSQLIWVTKSNHK